MHIIFNTFTAILAPVARAAGIEDVGKYTGSMWTDITKILPYRNLGARGDGPSIATGIVIKTVLTLIGSVAVLVILIAAVQIAISGGNEESVTKAKKVILYAVLGLVLAILGNTIITAISNCIIAIANGTGTCPF